jgi:hypothetical protein
MNTFLSDLEPVICPLPFRFEGAITSAKKDPARIARRGPFAPISVKHPCQADNEPNAEMKQ